MALWDLQGSSMSRNDKGAHQGHVTAVSWGCSFHPGAAEDPEMSEVYLTGGQDGVVRVWDARSRAGCQGELDLHTNEKGRGAVGFIQPCPATGQVRWVPSGLDRDGQGGEHRSTALFVRQVVTAGADGTVCVVDPRSGFETVSRTKLTDFPYELKVAGSLALAGCGDGSLHVIDTKTGATQYALGANRAAVRYIAASEGKLVAAGDDGTAILYDF